MIKLEEISKDFKGRQVLQNFNLEIKEGEFVSIVGASGAGKTTVLNIIGLLTQPDTGNVMIKDCVNPSAKDTMKLRRYYFSYIFQNYVLMDNETVAENLRISKKYNPDYQISTVKQTLELVCLNESFLEQKIYQLSGGEQQRIAIARAMLKKCEVILADEPTGNLDGQNKRLVIDLFQKLKEMGKTIICVTHDEDMAKEADRIIKI